MMMSGENLRLVGTIKNHVRAQKWVINFWRCLAKERLVLRTTFLQLQFTSGRGGWKSSLHYRQPRRDMPIQDFMVDRGDRHFTNSNFVHYVTGNFEARFPTQRETISNLNSSKMLPKGRFILKEKGKLLVNNTKILIFCKITSNNYQSRMPNMTLGGVYE